MNNDQDTDNENLPAKKLTQKEFAKKIRREAYQRAKDYKKSDPREIARKAKAKEQRREAYQKAKERNKLTQKSQREKMELKDHIVLAAQLDERPLAPVISLDSVRKKALKKTLQPTEEI